MFCLILMRQTEPFSKITENTTS